MLVPVRPDGDGARRLLEAELSKPEYHQGESLLVRLVRWFEAHLPDAQGPALPWVVGLIVLLALLLAGLLLAVSRLRDAREVLGTRRTRQAGLTDPDRTSTSYREEAQQLLAAGMVDRAVVAAFRALVVELDDRDVVRDAPGRTAGEVAHAAAAAHPSQAGALRQAAWSFDRACYGHPDGPLPRADEPQRCTPDEVEQLLSLRPGQVAVG